MAIGRSNTERALRWATRLGFALALTAGAASAASAQNLFEALFGGFNRPAARAYADPNTDGRYDSARRAATNPQIAGGGSSYCVRTCDGRYFPMQRHAGTTPAQICGAMCPAAQTKIFSGGEIARATAPDGSHYEDMDNAFAYRQRIVDNCTCNGKDAFGLAPLDVNTDPTLRVGDIVATTNGLMAYSAARARRGAETASNFTPVDTAQISRDLKDKLANTAIARQ